MGYEEIDDVINRWSKYRNWPFYTSYQEAEIRSFGFADHLGNMYQMWIDKPTPSGEIKVHIWNYKSKWKKKVEHFSVSKPELFDCLEKGYEIITSWMPQKPAID